MKYIIIIFLLLSTTLTIAQNRVVDEYDYFSWNNLDETEVHYYHFQHIIRAYQKENPAYQNRSGLI